jgi:hypothetical protein
VREDLIGDWKDALVQALPNLVGIVVARKIPSSGGVKFFISLSRACCRYTSLPIGSNCVASRSNSASAALALGIGETPATVGALAVIVSMVAGCGVIPGYQERFEAARAAQQARIDNADDGQCRRYGALPGTDAYVACRMNIANNRQAADEAQRQAWLGHY